VGDVIHTPPNGKKAAEAPPPSDQDQFNRTSVPLGMGQGRYRDACGAPSSTTSRPASGWPGSLAIFALGSALMLWQFQSEIGAAIRVWRDSETFGHAFFVLPIVMFLLYRLRHRLARIQPVAWPWALLPIAALTIVWLLGTLTTLTIVQQLAFVAMWQCYFLLVFGWVVTRECIFPIAYLYLAVPFGLSVIPLLQDITAQIVVRLLRLTGVPVFLDGYHIEIPDGSFLIAEACSGVRYLIVCIALGILAAYLFFHSWKRRLLFVGLSVTVPIVANGIRAYGIVMIAHLSHYTLAVDVDHVVYGFIFLSLVTLCLLGFGALLRDRTRHPDLPDRRAMSAVPHRPKLVPQLPSAAGSLAIIFLAQYWVGAAQSPPADRDVALHGPAISPPWEALEGAPGEWTPDFHGMDAQFQQGYRRENGRVDLAVAYYAYQREGAEAVSDLNAITREGSPWKLLQARRTDVKVDGRVLPINQALLGQQDRTILVWYWYWVDGEVTNTRVHGKLLEAKALVTGGERDAAIVAVSAKVTENVEKTAAMLQDFLRQSEELGGMTLRVETKSSLPASSGDARSLNLMGESVTP
jgi:exosortase A